MLTMKPIMVKIRPTFARLSSYLPLFIILYTTNIGPVNTSAKVTVQGDILLGGIFPIHQKGVSKNVLCGKINKDRGIQRLEAMLFAIDRINNDSSLLPDIKLGAIALDTCSSDSYALNQSLEFIRASINTVESSAFQCTDGSMPRPKYGMKVISGVVGGSYSEVSLQVANLLRLFRIPQVSYASTGTSLSDKTRYDFFARTVPPDTFQARVLVDIVQTFNWSYVSIVSSEGQYGDSGMKAFMGESAARNICIAINEKVPHSATWGHFDAIFSSLLKKPNARGVVLFVRMEDARGILEAAKRANNINFFTWIGSDGWGKEEKLVEGLEEVAEGALTVELGTTNVPGFDQYMKSLRPENNGRNPWFAPYWESLFDCRLPGRPGEPEPSGPGEDSGQENRTRNSCSPDLRIDETIGYTQETKVQFVVDAVYAFAHALDRAWRDLCMFDHGSPAHETGHLLYTRHHSSVCKKLKELDGGHFYKNYLLEVNFTDIAGSMVRFDSQGDGLGRYNIYNYQRSEANSSSFGYKVVGKWFDEELSLDTSALLWNERTRVPPASVCSYPCSVGEVKITQVGDVCCWICNPCKDQEYVVGQFTCKKCPDGWWPTGDKADCYELPEQYMQWDSVFAIVPMVIAIVGILLTTFVIRTFMVHMETPIVKASGRELSFILLAGILVSFLMTFALLAKPSLLVCSFQRFGVGFGFSIMYGALLTKTNRISRIFDSARRSARRPSFISPKSQVIICAIFVGIQVLTTIVWFILEPPGVRHWFPDLNRKSEVVLKCKVKDPNFLFSLIYNMLLITTCTVYAGMTRKIPENFNESKFIGFTMYTTCIIWLSFVPLFFTTGNSFQIQITTLCVSISLSAYVALFCLFSPKIYIILFHPDKNVRKLTMNSATYKKAPTSSSAFPTNTGSNHGSIDQVKMRPVVASRSNPVSGGQARGQSADQQQRRLVFSDQLTSSEVLLDGLPEERAKLLEPVLTRSASGSTGSGISQVKSGPVGGGPPLAPVGRKRGSLVKRASEGKTEVEIVQETTPGDLSSQCDNKAHDEPTAAPVGLDSVQPTCPATSGPLLSPLSASHTKSMPSPSAVINAMELETLATL